MDRATFLPGGRVVVEFENTRVSMTLPRGDVDLALLTEERRAREALQRVRRLRFVKYEQNRQRIASEGHPPGTWPYTVERLRTKTTDSWVVVDERIDRRNPNRVVSLCYRGKHEAERDRDARNALA